ncbi:MAG: hypothetical protein KF861_18255 [Planctomycetaceae bacterium]|nr:hypothetical protein [Planctomycetaceae bacterium]
MLEQATAWFRANGDIVWGLTICSAVMFVGTLLVVPILLARIPEDYFLHPPRLQTQGWDARHPLTRVTVRIAKNILGVVIVVAGLAMLILPGQGLLTVLVGGLLLDLPGKRGLEVALLRRPHVYRAVDWLRKRANRPPLQLPPPA